jgi:hypothetical protein
MMTVEIGSSTGSIAKPKAPPGATGPPPPPFFSNTLAERGGCNAKVTVDEERKVWNPTCKSDPPDIQTAASVIG